MSDCIRVLAILPNNMAIVSTEGLRRVTIGEEERIIGELLPVCEADVMAEAARACGGKAAVTVAVVDYDSLAPEVPAGPTDDDDGDFIPDVLAILPGFVVVSSLGMYRVSIEPQGFVEWELMPHCEAKSWVERNKPSKFWDLPGGTRYVMSSYDDLAAGKQPEPPVVVDVAASLPSPALAATA